MKGAAAMLLTSGIFLLFLPAVAFFYYLAPQKAKPYLLLFASCIFYFSFGPGYFVLLFGTTLVTYFGGLFFAPGRTVPYRKLLFFLQVCLSLSGLFVYKYLNFSSLLLAGFLSHVGVNISFQAGAFSFASAVSISFYTFQALGYVIDVYIGKIPPKKNFVHLALYVSFFPLVLSGPIARAGTLLPQLEAGAKFDTRTVEEGAVQMLWGYFKKLVLADGLAVFVNTVYNFSGNYTPAATALATFLFSFQIYFDFSGYTDIAIGAARTLGIELPKNFDNPYFATNIRAFWARWHVSLSTWFRDYVYIPLGGSRRGTLRTLFNKLAVFLLSGLWHGASFTFLVWGLYHGILNGISTLLAPWQEKLYARVNTTFLRLPYRAVQMLITFVLVTFSYIFFRASSLNAALSIAGGFFFGVLSLFNTVGTTLAAIGFYTHNGPALLLCTCGVLLFEKFATLAKNGKEAPAFLRAGPVYLRWPVYWLLLLLILFLGNFGQSAFIYMAY